MKRSLRTAVLMALLLSAVAEASLFDRKGNKLPDKSVNSSKVNWENVSLFPNPLVPDENTIKTISPVGKLQATGFGHCTATFLDTHGDDTTPAYVISAGHCVPGHLNGEEILGPKDNLRLAGLIFTLIQHYNIPSPEWHREIGVSELTYATMRGIDIMIAKLSISYGFLRSRGYVPLELDSRYPHVDEAVVNYAIPSNFTKPKTRVLKMSKCSLSGVGIEVREGDWSWSGAIKGRCNSVGGMSGSPVVSEETGKIIGILNTSVDDRQLGSAECVENRPCEVHGDRSIETDLLATYSQRVDGVAGCFANGLFDQSLPACRLPKASEQ